jgi:ADP-ribosyl-[dinitrogen reductase] hydrolase
MSPSEARLRDVLAGVLLGTAVGDALGLPAENLSSRRIRRWWKGEWRMRFVFGRGMISDDTEHTLMVAQALLSHPGDADKFQRCLGWKFRWWLTALPAGVGLATARACLKLWLGFPTHKSAVRSAGSGPAMRSAIIGAYFYDQPERRRSFVLASSRLTHRSWQAETAALAISECAALAIQTEQSKLQVVQLLEVLRSLSSEPEWQQWLARIESSISAGLSVSDFARSAGLTKGVTGYALHVAPVAVYAWLRHPGDFRTAMVQTLECGGDTDTVGAILGALTGAATGSQGIPKAWLDRILEWPRSTTFMEKVADKLAEQRSSNGPLGPVRFFWPALIARNLFFLLIVLLHGFRRLLPPY